MHIATSDASPNALRPLRLRSALRISVGRDIPGHYEQLHAAISTEKVIKRLGGMTPSVCVRCVPLHSLLRNNILLPFHPTLCLMHVLISVASGALRLEGRISRNQHAWHTTTNHFSRGRCHSNSSCPAVVSVCLLRPNMYDDAWYYTNYDIIFLSNPVAVRWPSSYVVFGHPP